MNTHHGNFILTDKTSLSRICYPSTLSFMTYICVTLHWSLPLDVCNPVISHILLHSKDSCLPTCNCSSSLFTLFMEKSSTVSFFLWIARSFCWFCVFSAFLLLVGNNLISSLIWRLQHFMPFLLLLKHLYIFYLCVCVCMQTYMLVSMEIRRGCWIPCS